MEVTIKINGRYLITGGSGFIGTNLITTLISNGVEIRNIDIVEPLELTQKKYWKFCNILDKSELTRHFDDFQPTHIIHLAARTDLKEKISISGYNTNIDGTRNVLDIANLSKSVCFVLVTSSMLVYKLGWNPKDLDDYSPPNLYGESKVLTEKITRTFGLRPCWVIIRPTTVWGPWNMRYRDELFTILKKGLYFHPGSNQIRKTYGYVGNVVHQILSLANSNFEEIKGKTYYVGDPPLELLEWIDSFSLALRNKKVTRVPILLLKMLALVGDLLVLTGINFPITSFRLRNITQENIIDVSPILAIAGYGPFTVEE